MKIRNFICAALLISTGLTSTESVLAGKDDDTLRVALPREMDTLDIYTNTTREGVIMSRMVWDGLLFRDPVTQEYKGNLATKWFWENDTTLIVELHKGIKYHNGEPFDADDVVFTLNWVADPANGAKPRRNVGWIKSAEKLENHKVRINLNKPFPAALEYLSGPVVIYPNEYFSKLGPGEFGKAPVGTGPYKVTEVQPGKAVNFEKYDDYHLDSPKTQPSIRNIKIRMIPDKNTQIAELLSGGLDWIWQTPADQAEKIKEMGRFTVKNESTMRIGYLGFDASGRFGKNPMNDLRVRKAIAHAINREGIVKALVRGASKVVHSACFPTQLGCEQDVTKYEYNPVEAKKLLADAGYPDGFKIPFYAYRNRDYAEAMINDLKNVGIDVDFTYMQVKALRSKLQADGVPFQFMTWGSYSINDVSAITSHFFKQGKDDYARDDELKNWLDKGDGSTDVKVRKSAYSKALKRISEQVYWLPLWSYNTNYVFSSDLNFIPTSDEIPRFFTATWK